MLSAAVSGPLPSKLQRFSQERNFTVINSIFFNIYYLFDIV